MLHLFSLEKYNRDPSCGLQGDLTPGVKAKVATDLTALALAPP